MQKFLVFVAFLTSCAVRAQDVYVVMHTEEAAKSGIDDAVYAALSERALKVAFAPTALELSTGLHAAACKSGHDVCALAVGRALGASRVIASTTTAASDSWTVALALHDIAAGVIVRREFTGSHAAATRWARVEALTWAGQAPRGTLVVEGLPDGALLLIDATDALVVPMTKPAPLSVGEHELQARFNDGPVYQQRIVIVAEEQTTITLCPRGSDIAACAEVKPDDVSPLRVAGIVGVAVGVVAVAGGVVFNLLANDRTIDSSAEDEKQQFKTMSTIAMASYVSGGALIVGGIAATIIGGVSE
jgi:hypothetical protein